MRKFFDYNQLRVLFDPEHKVSLWVAEISEIYCSELVTITSAAAATVRASLAATAR